jgi:hypothetical protein
VEADKISAIHQELRQLTAEVALLKAQSTGSKHTASPWLPLKDAAVRLNYKSARALRNYIRNGHFPPDCYRVDPTASGRVTRYLIHVERYINKLR